MSLIIKTTTQPEDAAKFIASSVLDKIKNGQIQVFSEAERHCSGG